MPNLSINFTMKRRDRWLALTETLEPVHAVSFVVKYATPLCAELRDAKCTSTPEVDTPEPAFANAEFVHIERCVLTRCLYQISELTCLG